MAVQYRKQLGQALRERRDELEMTQAQVAEGVESYLRERGQLRGERFEAQNISRWERGANLGRPENLEAVAHALDTTVAALMAGVQPAQRSRQTSQLDRIESMLQALLRDRLDLPGARDTLMALVEHAAPSSAHEANGRTAQGTDDPPNEAAE